MSLDKELRRFQNLPTDTPPNMGNVEHKFMESIVWKKSKCHVLICARSVEGWLADSEISSV